MLQESYGQTYNDGSMWWTDAAPRGYNRSTRQTWIWLMWNAEGLYSHCLGAPCLQSLRGHKGANFDGMVGCRPPDARRSPPSRLVALEHQTAGLQRAGSLPQCKRPPGRFRLWVHLRQLLACEAVLRVFVRPGNHGRLPPVFQDQHSSPASIHA